MQLELFNPPMYKNDYIFLLEKSERLRKSMHARISVQQKELKELKELVDLLVSNICTGMNDIQKAM